jgi:hypothetical protein
MFETVIPSNADDTIDKVVLTTSSVSKRPDPTTLHTSFNIHVNF